MKFSLPFFERGPAAALVLGIGASVSGGVVPQGDLAVDLVRVASGLSAPTQVVGAGDGSGRLFVVDQTGRIRIISGGVLLPTPFLDLSTTIPALNAVFDERGLLGLAFHPDYANNGRFFVRFSRPRAGVAGEPCFGTSRGCHEEVLAEFSVSSADANIANPTPNIMFTINKPQFNHNGGAVHFGPDGYLYFTLGDGGGANDGLADMPPSHGPIGNAQNLNAFLGKMHRIDVDGAFPYTIPADNPFVGVDGLDEIWAYGLRNPFQFSFDDRAGGDGTLWCADVGQNQFEEIDFILPGRNYGWVIMEGLHCFNPFSPNTPPPSCDMTGLTMPVAEYDHSTGVSVIGGYVYRGARSPALFGQYICGDFSALPASPAGVLFNIDTAESPLSFRKMILGGDNHPLARFVKGTGRDDEGELYFCLAVSRGPSGATGEVWHVLQRRCMGDADRSGSVDMKDLTDTINHWNTNYLPGTGAGDSNSDGLVNFADITLTLAQFMHACD